jgi:hypothetical protein
MKKSCLLFVIASAISLLYAIESFGGPIIFTPIRDIPRPKPSPILACDPTAPQTKAPNMIASLIPDTFCCNLSAIDLNARASCLKNNAAALNRLYEYYSSYLISPLLLVHQGGGTPQVPGAPGLPADHTPIDNSYIASLASFVTNGINSVIEMHNVFLNLIGATYQLPTMPLEVPTP